MLIGVIVASTVTRAKGGGMAATRADVARRANVSPALVSYVLNNGPRPVSAEARARIEKAIRELDYRPNSIAQALRGASTRTIGLLLPSAVNRFFGELATAIEEALFETGNTLAVGISADDPARESRYIDTFVDRRVDGIMVISSHSLQTLTRLADVDTPVMVLDRVPDRLPVSSVAVDNRTGVTAAVEHLFGHGHTRVACIGGRVGTESADERVLAWRSFVAPIVPDADALLARADFTEDGGYEAMRELFAGDVSEHPTALFVSSDIQTSGALRACADLGVRVPEDLAVVSFDGALSTAYAVPSVTSYRQPVERIAYTAVEGLLAQIANPSRLPTHTVLPGELVVRCSCGCPA